MTDNQTTLTTFTNSGKEENSKEKANLGESSHQKNGTGKTRGETSKKKKYSTTGPAEQYDLPHPLARQWLSTRHGTKFSDGSVLKKESKLRLYLGFLSEKEVELLEAEFEDYLEFVEYRVSLGLTGGTILNDYFAIKDFYAFVKARADEEPAIDWFALEELDLEQYNTATGFERDALAVEEVEALFDSFKNRRNKIMAYLGVATGLRNSDIREAKLEHVDYEDLMIHVPEPKGNDPYDVPMSKELARRLKQWENVGRKSLPRHQESEYLFPSEYGAKIERNNTLNDAVKRAAERAGIQEVIGTSPITGGQLGNDSDGIRMREWHRVTVHTLRHTFVTLLKKAGVPPEARRLVANHEDIQTTKEYEHFDKNYHELIRSVLGF